MGNSKINGLGGNAPQVNLNVVEANQPVQQPNVQPEGPGQQDPGVDASKLSQGEQLVKQLDVLLLRAAKGSAKIADIQELKQAVRGFDLASKERKALNAAIDQVVQGMQSIQKFTGRELATAVDFKDDVFAWADNDAGEAVQALLDAQATLSEQLGKILNTAKPDAKTAEFLEEAMLQCDRRASELTTLVMQFADLTYVEPNNPEVAARLDKKLSRLLPAQSLKMHGNAEALARMQEQVAPLAKRLDEFAAKTNASVSDAELATMRHEIRVMSEALDQAIREGLPSGENGHVQVDKSLMREAKKILDQVGAKFEDVRKGVGSASMKKVVVQAFVPLPDCPILSEELRPVLKLCTPYLAAAASRYEELVRQVRQFADDPSTENMNNLVDAYTKYRELCQQQLDKISKELVLLYKIGISNSPAVALDTAIRHRVHGGHELSNELMRKFALKVEDLAYAGAQDDSQKSQLSELLQFFDKAVAVGSQVAHLCEMKGNIEDLKLDEMVTTSSVRLAFAGNFSTSTLVEARIHGMSDADIDPMMDDSRMVSSHKLGNGNANTVFEVTYKDGKSFVFKPEASGRMGMGTLMLGRRGYAAQLQTAQINLAVQKTADTLGLGDIMVKTTAGSHQGVFGLFMEKAPGVSASDFAKKPNQAPPDGLSLNDIKKQLPPDQYEKVVGQLMRQQNRLQWFDLITGQGDRHGGNYFIHVGKDLKVTLKAIDNDMSYADYRIGHSKFLLKGEHAEKFSSLVKTAQTQLYPAELGPTNLLPDPGVEITENGIIVDTSKVKSPELIYCANMSVGHHDSAMPNVIDQDLYDKLVALKGGEARQAYLDDLRSRLSDESLAAATARLDEAIAHAEKLKAEGKVLSPEEFESRENQKKILNNHSTMKLPKRHNMASLASPEAKEATKQFRKHNCDMFSRDLLAFVNRPGWFSNK